MPGAAAAWTAAALIVMTVAQAVFSSAAGLARGCKLGQRSLDLVASGRRRCCLRRGDTVCAGHVLSRLVLEASSPANAWPEAQIQGLYCAVQCLVLVFKCLVALLAAKVCCWQEEVMLRRGGACAPVVQLPWNPNDLRPRLPATDHAPSSHVFTCQSSRGCLSPAIITYKAGSGNLKN